jgi:hypothetical protein
MYISLLRTKYARSLVIVINLGSLLRDDEQVSL